MPPFPMTWQVEPERRKGLTDLLALIKIEAV
jgi:hypothetical protein